MSERVARSWAVVVLVVSLLAVPVGASAQREIVVDRIMARVNGDIVTRSDMVRMLPIYLQVVARVTPDQLRSASGRQRMAEEFLQYLIDTQLIVERARAEDMAMSMSDVDRYLEGYRESMEMSESQFRRALEQEGVQYDDYRSFMQGHLTRMQLMRTSVLGDISVTDEELEAAVRQRYPDGFAQQFLTTSHVLLALSDSAMPTEVDRVMREAASLRERILAGEATLEETAAEVNIDSTRARRGRVGTFAQGDLDPDYTRAALGLEVGELSEPVRTRFGVHLIRLDGLERRQVEDGERIRERLRYELMEEQALRQEELYLQRLREEAFVEVRSQDFGL